MNENITTVKANELSILDELDNGKSFVMVDRDSNDGTILNYNTLINSIVERFISSTATNDSLKLYIVD